MESIDELYEYAARATQDGVWGQLLNRGAAWSIMRRDGELPPEAPRRLGATIATDLAEHGFSLLRVALGLREREGPSEFARKAFEMAANSFESLVRNGEENAVERGYYRTLAAAAYHLAGYSAIAYSLFGEDRRSFNEAPIEVALSKLILRDMNGLRLYVRKWLTDNNQDDDGLVFALDQDHVDPEDAIASILNVSACRAFAFYDFALQTGDVGLVEQARGILAAAQSLAADAGVVPLWWIIRLCRSLIDDLWASSLHQSLPTDAPPGGDAQYAELRKLFIATLFYRKTAEVELWPSQREAARRSTDITDDLVVALPTSAGKTRVAEIAALMTLSAGRRVLIVTPLRALSAQTERTFRKTFAPLGFTVSSLYGAAGVSQGDEDALRTRDVIIATPEKLDFALRSDPTLIDDIGLIVLDEGHLIGPSEREIRYEILVQRLLRRPDAADRRIVCLSAILPDGEQLDDLTAWIRSDVAGEPVRSAWRPTRQRFGAITWHANAAKLSFDLEADGPFLPRFVEAVEPLGRDRKRRPKDNKELTLFSAWEFADQGKRTLIFITQANWVESYGKSVVALTNAGYLPSLLEDEADIARALEIGTEWLGADHPAVQCLKVGVAVHHGRLPNPFLRELELLLSRGILKVTIASPTLSQGLNLNAAVLLAPVLYRAGKAITGEEFANVAGRAGRAFIDVEGLVLHVMHSPDDWRMAHWRELVASAKSRALQSGIVQIIDEVIKRLTERGTFEREDAYEYLANAREAWIDPDEGGRVDAGGDAEDGEDELEEEPLSHLVEKLDATVIGLVEALDADSADLPRLLDEALLGSLWARQIARREDENGHDWQRFILASRARLIWSHTTEIQRRGHFAMGVGLDTGLILDEMADTLAPLIDQADTAALAGDADALTDALAALAERLMTVRPFVPDREIPPNWKAILRGWVSGAPVTTIGVEHMRFVEDAFAYRMVWALEAVRTRRQVMGWESDTIAGGGAAAFETGVPDYRMSMLIRAGLPSRRAAIAAIENDPADFLSGPEMRAWLESDAIVQHTNAGNWPTPDTADLWKRFREDSLRVAVARWRSHREDRPVSGEPDDTEYRGICRVEQQLDGSITVLTPDYKAVCSIDGSIYAAEASLVHALMSADISVASLTRLGPGQQL